MNSSGQGGIRWWLIGGACVVVALLLESSRWWVPNYLHGWLQQQLPPRTGLQLSLGEIEFNPWQTRLKLGEVALLETEKPVLKVEQLVVDAAFWGSLTQLQAEIAAITVSGLETQLAASAQRGWLARAWSHWQQRSAPESAEQGGSGSVAVHIRRLQLQHSEVALEQPAPRLPTTPLQLRTLILHDLEWQPAANEPEAFRLSIGLPGAGSLQWHGHYRQQQRRAQGDLRFSLPDLAQWRPWIGAWSQIVPFAGEFELTGRLTLGLEEGSSWLHLQAGQVALAQLDWRLATDEQPVMTLKRGSLKDLEVDSRHREVRLQQLELQQPHWHQWRNEAGELGYQHWLVRAVRRNNAAAQQGTAEQAKAGASSEDSAATNGSGSDSGRGTDWELAIVDTTVSDGAIHWLDQRLPGAPTYRLTAMDIDMGHFSLQGRQATDFDLSGRLNDQGKVSLQGNITLLPLHADVQYRWEQQPLAALAPIWQRHLNLSAERGLLQSEGDFSVNWREPRRLQWQGDVVLTDVALVRATTGSSENAAGASSVEPIFSWQKANVAAASIDTQQRTVRIDHALLVKPDARVQRRSDGSLNWLQLRPSAATATNNEREAEHESPANPTNREAPQSASDVTASAAAQSAWQISLSRAELRAGRVRLADRAVAGGYREQLSDLHLEWSTPTTDESASTAKVNAEARLSEQSTLNLRANLDHPFLASQRRVDAEITLLHYPLSLLSPYARAYLGYPTTGGDLDLAADYRLNGQQLRGQHKVTLHQPQLGAQVGEAPVPLPMALDLLADTNDVVELNFSIDGDTAQPEINWLGLVQEALSSTVMKTLTAPLELVTEE